MSFFKHVALHKYDLTDHGVSRACYDEIVASGSNASEAELRILAVSYTHLTLPTNREV